MGTSPLDRVRKICLALPGAFEKLAWGAPTFRAGGRQFAMFADNHHGVGFVGLWVKGAPGAQEVLVESDPARFFVPPYVGPSGWVGIRLDRGVDWKIVTALVREGYDLVAPKPKGKPSAAPKRGRRPAAKPSAAAKRPPSRRSPRLSE